MPPGSVLSVAADADSAKLNPLRPHNMEAFLEALATFIDEHDDLTVIDVLGALQLTQQRIALDALLGDEDAE